MIRKMSRYETCILGVTRNVFTGFLPNGIRSYNSPCPIKRLVEYFKEHRSVIHNIIQHKTSSKISPSISNHRNRICPPPSTSSTDTPSPTVCTLLSPLSAEVSAKRGTNISDLLDKILLQAEMLDLKANPTRPAQEATPGVASRSWKRCRRRSGRDPVRLDDRQRPCRGEPVPYGTPQAGRIAAEHRRLGALRPGRSEREPSQFRRPRRSERGLPAGRRGTRCVRRELRRVLGVGVRWPHAAGHVRAARRGRHPRFRDDARAHARVVRKLRNDAALGGARRVARLDEQLAVCRTCWSDTRRKNHHQRRYHGGLSRSPPNMRPATRPMMAPMLAA